jgi:hypothetical protein
MVKFVMAYFYQNTEILIEEDFITKEQADYLVGLAVAKSNKDWESQDGNDYEFWNGKNLLVDNLEDLDHTLLKEIQLKTKLLYELFHPELKGKVSYSYVSTINRFKSGDSMPVHSDRGPDENNNAILHGVVVYLNDNYQGGEIYYPEKNIAIKPKKCSLVMHPGNEEYQHGVREVIKGDRYAITLFIHERKDMYKNQ